MCIVSDDLGQKTIVDTQESETSRHGRRQEGGGGGERVLEKVQHPLKGSEDWGLGE